MLHTMPVTCGKIDATCLLVWLATEQGQLAALDAHVLSICALVVEVLALYRLPF
jgi:hypothetical protein